MNLFFTEPKEWSIRSYIQFLIKSSETRKIMRISVFNILLLFACIQVMHAHTTKGQGLDKILVSIEMKNESLEFLFEKLTEMTGLSFVFPRNEITAFKNISMTKAERSVKKILDLALKQKPFAYRQEGNTILIYAIEEKGRQKEKNNKAETRDEELLGINKLMLSIVTGTITNADGPMAGVNVIVKGTTRGTTTDIEGKFSIEAKGDDVLVFSFIGFKTFEAQVSGRSVIDVVMEVDATELGEVIVNAGYWHVTKEKNTGNIARVTSEEISKQPVSNSLQALQGRMPGVYIQQTTGVPGGGFTLQIRGQNSIRSFDGVTDPNSPLYIVDGVPFPSSSLSSSFTSQTIIPGANPLNNINPSDIESIEVLKDADATAIYGSRGANGVVLITTKKAKGGKTKFDINVYSGVGEVGQMKELLNTPQYLEMRNEAFDNDEATPTAFDYDVNGTWDKSRYTDWQKELIGGSAHMTNMQGTISGGGERTHFLFSGRYFKETTVFPGKFYDKKLSGNFNLTHSSENNKFKVVLLTNYLIDDSTLPLADLTSQTYTLAPNAPSLYDAEGNLNWENSTWVNPLAELRKQYLGKTYTLVTNANLSYQIVPNLQIKTNLGYTSVKMKEIRMQPISASNPTLGVTSGLSFFANNEINTWILEPQIQYDRRVSMGDLNVLVGLTFQENIQENIALRATGFTNDTMLENIGAASSITALNSGYAQYRYHAIFSRINYNWESKYLINLTARRDGSTRFGPGNQFANFGAIGFAWIFTNENFFKDKSFLSFGKLRSSFGITGSDQIGDYQYLGTYSYTSYPYQGSSGLYPTRLVNPDYAWETNKKLEGGIELAFINDRIRILATYYRNRSSNQLVGKTLPKITGKNSIQYNLPATVQNTGWELELYSDNIKSNNFSWSTTFNITIPHNKLIEFPDLQSSSYNNRYVVGKPLNIEKRYHYIGVDPETGIYAFEDLDADGALSPTFDRQFLKQRTQNYYGGLGNTINYKAFQFDIFFQFVKQTGYNYISFFSRPPGYFYNQPVIVMDRWKNPGDENTVQKFTQTFSTTAFAMYNNGRSYGDNMISDASFMRLKNISIAYYLPTRWLDKVNLQSTKIYLQGQNILTFTDYLVGDPENQNASYLPPLRVITAGAQLIF